LSLRAGRVRRTQGLSGLGCVAEPEGREVLAGFPRVECFGGPSCITMGARERQGAESVEEGRRRVEKRALDFHAVCAGLIEQNSVRNGRQARLEKNPRGGGRILPERQLGGEEEQGRQQNVGKK